MCNHTAGYHQASKVEGNWFIEDLKKYDKSFMFKYYILYIYISESLMKFTKYLLRRSK